MKVVSYTDQDIQKAKDYITSTSKSIVYPTETIEELEKLFNGYLAMGSHAKFESDEACRAIFKCPNRDLYNLVKANLLQKAEPVDDDPNVQTRSIPEQFIFCEGKINPLDYDLLEDYKPTTFTEGVALKEANIVINALPPNTDYGPPEVDYPYFTSVEIIARKATLPDVADGYMTVNGTVCAYLSYKEWFEGLQDAERGIITESFQKQIPKWISEVRKTWHEYCCAKTVEERSVKEQTLIQLGWNPAIDFNEENRVLATNRFHKAIHENCKYEVVDLSADLLDESNHLVKPLIKNVLHPVYIVLVEGKSLFSAITKKVDKGPFSHVAISLDEKLDKMYSFNMEGAEGKAGGLSIESVKNYPQKNRLGVFTIFVKEEDLATIRNLLEYYLKNAKKTTYSIFNLLLLPFKRAVKMDFSMICSEFVDNLLKLCNISIVDKESPLVTPNDFYRASISNTKIYKIYEGSVEDYKGHLARRKVERIQSSGKYIKEACILEIKEFPIQFSDEGDLLISNMSKLDYEEEYQKSHKLLLAYRKASNIEGMKYELSKLWFLNQLLERDIYANKNVLANSRCRSRVLNDFNTYMDIVLKKDPGFNFSEYYTETPFSNAKIKIKGSTLKYTIDYVKQALMPTV